VEALALPAAPVQVKEKVVLAASGPVDSGPPEVGFVPSQPPEAVQSVAFVDDQVRFDAAPLATTGGSAESVTVGESGGGGVPGTATVVEALALPPGPVHVRENTVLVLSGPVDSLPAVVFVPDQPPEAEHELAFLELQLNCAESPLATVSGLAASVTVGAGLTGLPESGFPVAFEPESSVPHAPTSVRPKMPALTARRSRLPSDDAMVIRSQPRNHERNQRQRVRRGPTRCDLKTAVAPTRPRHAHCFLAAMS
jgi:hypothetical protein